MNEQFTQNDLTQILAWELSEPKKYYVQVAASNGFTLFKKIRNIIIHQIFTVMGKAIEINDSNFDQIIAGDQPVMIDFWADWCGPCKMIAPSVEELASEFEGKAVVGKLDVQENSQVPSRYGIRNIPTLLIFKNGQLVDKQVGVVPKAVLAQKLSAAMETNAK